jgi:hypothetical protein
MDITFHYIENNDINVDTFSNRIDLREYEEYYPVLLDLDESVELLNDKLKATK